MAMRQYQPLQSGFAVFAAVISLIGLSTAPAIAAPDRNFCEDAAEPTLKVATTEFSQATASTADDSIEFMGSGFDMDARELAKNEDEAPEKAEHAVEEDADNDSRDAALPTDSGPLVYKRQMYRRDI